jgi:hypothetical protein
MISEQAKTTLGRATPIPGPYPSPLPKVPVSGREIKGRKFAGDDVAQIKDLIKQGNVVFTQNEIRDSAEQLLHGRLSKNILFFQNKYRNLHPEKNGKPTLLIYPGESKHTSLDDYKLLFLQEEFENIKAADTFELKCTGVQIRNCRGRFTVRVRHGENSVIADCPDCAKVKLRCGPHWVVNCPKAEVVAYAGNLFGKKGEWEDHHVDGGGHNMQCAYCAQIAGVRSVTLGYHFGENDKKYPATECNIAPGVPVKEILHKGTTRGPMKLPDLNMKLRGAEAEEDYERLAKDERGMARELDTWFGECVAAALKACEL